MAREPRWKRMNLNVETNLHDAFKASTAAQGKKMTDVLIEFIRALQGREKYRRKKTSTRRRPARSKAERANSSTLQRSALIPPPVFHE
jgi:hypothetical protein